METYQIRTSDDYSLSLTYFSPAQENKKILLINPATGVKQTYYHTFAKYFSEKGFRVYTYDYRGIGSSSPHSLKGFKATASDWAEKDMHAVINYIRQKHPQYQLITIGHSMGGQLIGLCPVRHSIDLIVLIATQSGYWKLWPVAQRFSMFLNWYVIVPVLTRLFGYFPGKKLGSMENLPKGAALEWAKWCRSPHYLFDYKKEANRQFADIIVPLIAYSFRDDTYAPKSAVEWMVNCYQNARITRKHIDPQQFSMKDIGHFGFFRSKSRKNLWGALEKDITAIFP